MNELRPVEASALSTTADADYDTAYWQHIRALAAQSGTPNEDVKARLRQAFRTANAPSPTRRPADEHPDVYEAA